MMKRSKYNKDYGGEVIIVGFTGNAEKIQAYLKKTFDIKSEDEKVKISSKQEEFNIEVEDEVLAHVEVYPWSSRERLIKELAILEEL